MTKQTEAMTLALEALKLDRAWLETDAPKMAWDKNNEAITALREALAGRPAQQEPVAVADGTFNHNCPVGTPLYTSPPPQRTSPQAERAAWVGLTYEEAKEIYTCIHGYDSSKRIAEAIEAKLKEKNCD